MHQGVVHLWDWEHATDPAPYGFDDLHWYLAEAVQLRGAELASCHADAERLPSASSSPEPDLLVLAYLVEMSVRSCEVSGPSAKVPQPLLSGLAKGLEVGIQHSTQVHPSRRPR